jgi:hypothetical protein
MKLAEINQVAVAAIHFYIGSSLSPFPIYQGTNVRKENQNN